MVADAAQLLYTAEEAGVVLSLSRASIFKLISAGDLESVKIGRSRRVTRVGLERFVEHLCAPGTRAQSSPE